MKRTQSVLSFKSLSRLAAAVAVSFCFASSAAHAASFSFAGYTWDQDNTPNIGTRLGNGVNLGGAAFSAGLAGTAAGDVGFPDVAAGSHGSSTFITALTTARLTGVAITANTSRPLNLPSGNNGFTTRHGVELGWTGGRSFVNGIGNDLVLYESGSNGTSPENPMLRVRLAGTSTFSNWYYFAPDAFQLYHGNNTEGAFSTAINLSKLGLAIGDEIDLIQIANLMDADRIAGSVTHTFGGNSFGEGRVVFDGSSTVRPDAGAYAVSYRDTGFGNATLDPDPLYVGVLGSEIPEPGTLAMVCLALVVAVLVRRRVG
jgi:hypothetical protein